MAAMSKPIIYIGVLALGISAYTFMSGSGSSGKSIIGAAPATTKKAKADLYQKEDYEVHFPRLSVSTKNAFEPIVARVTAGVAGVGPDAVPFEMAGGDPNWVFTGNSEINGSANVLFENRLTSESEFVPVGTKWKNCTVSAVSDGKVTLTSHTGKKVQLRLADPDSEMALAGTQGTRVLRPVNPTLSGPINGRPVAIRPDNSRASTRGRTLQEQSDAN